MPVYPTRMSWLDGNEDSPASLAAVLQARPALLERFETFYDTLCDSEAVPVRTRELCRLRIAAIHGCEAEWNEASGIGADDRQAIASNALQDFSDAERAALDLAEALPFNHHGLRDEQVAAVRTHLGEAGTVALMTQCAFFDVVCRWKLTFNVQTEANP